MRNLLSVGEVGHQLAGDTEPVGDDPSYVHGVIGDPLDGRHDLEH